MTTVKNAPTTTLKERYWQTLEDAANLTKEEFVQKHPTACYIMWHIKVKELTRCKLYHQPA